MKENFLDYNEKVKKKVIDQRSNFIVKDDKIYTHDGEDISHLYNLSLNPSYISEKQLKSYESKQLLGEHEKENGGFVFMFYRMMQNMNEIFPELTKPDISRLLFLSTYVSYEENKIQYDNGRAITDKDLIELLRLNRNSYRVFIKKLVDNKILYINDNKEKILSLSFCRYGSININFLKNNDIGYIRLFKGTVRDLFNSTPTREIGRLSIIYMILPYLNLATNIVSYNPEEEDVDKVNPMPLIELSNTLQYKDYSKFKQSLYHVKIRGEIAFAFVLKDNDKRSMQMIVNPSITFAGDAEQLKVLRLFFKNFSNE